MTALFGPKTFSQLMGGMARSPQTARRGRRKGKNPISTNQRPPPTTSNPPKIPEFHKDLTQESVADLEQTPHTSFFFGSDNSNDEDKVSNGQDQPLGTSITSFGSGNAEGEHGLQQNEGDTVILDAPEPPPHSDDDMLPDTMGTYQGSASSEGESQEVGNMILIPDTGKGKSESEHSSEEGTSSSVEQSEETSKDTTAATSTQESANSKVTTHESTTSSSSNPRNGTQIHQEDTSSCEDESEEIIESQGQSMNGIAPPLPDESSIEELYQRYAVPYAEMVKGQDGKPRQVIVPEAVLFSAKRLVQHQSGPLQLDDDDMEKLLASAKSADISTRPRTRSKETDTTLHTFFRSRHANVEYTESAMQMMTGILDHLEDAAENLPTNARLDWQVVLKAYASVTNGESARKLHAETRDLLAPIPSEDS